MSTSREELATWFDEGVARQADYMIIVTSKVDWTDHPVYVTNGGEKSVHTIAQEYENDMTLTKVMEVYDLHGDRDKQMGAERTWAIPRPTPSATTRLTDEVIYLRAALKSSTLTSAERAELYASLERALIEYQTVLERAHYQGPVPGLLNPCQDFSN